MGIGEQHDLIFDAVGKIISDLSKTKCQKLLRPGGVFVSIEMSYKINSKELVS